MNREMKCRAWHKDEGKFLEISKLYVCDGAVMCVQDINEYEQEIDPPMGMDDKNLSLVWYTGLKDKNGVEIFEGDVIKTECGKIQVVEYINEVVDGEMCASGFFAWDKGLNTWMVIDTSDYVIGNRFENPELMEG